MAKRYEEALVGFTEEQEALRLAKRETESGTHAGNALLPGYAQLSAKYEKLLREFYKVLQISDTQSLNLIKMETELQALLDNAGQGFLSIDRRLLVRRSYSAECKRIFGRRIGGVPVAELLWPGDDVAQARFADALRLVFADPDYDLDALPAEIRHGDLHLRIRYKRMKTLDAGDESRLMLVVTDETAHRLSQQKLDYVSTHDSLTGLRNREYVERWLTDSKPEEVGYSVILADMNGLKLTNDVFGHLLGDELLVRASKLISTVVGDKGVCARWGGDEFLILLPGFDRVSCRALIERLEEECRACPSYPVGVSLSFGSDTSTRSRAEFSQLFLLAEKEMYKNKLLESREFRRKLVDKIADTMYERGLEDPAHIERVTTLAVKMAQRMGIPDNSPPMNMLIALARLHDVGKIAIPAETFMHDGPLTDEQWDIMRTHSEIGYRLAFSLGEPALAEAILAMHERWDGGGYPNGLQEAQIPELSRLLAVVDTYDTMTHDSPYRKAVSREIALLELMEGSGTQFDPRFVTEFVRYAEEIG